MADTQDDTELRTALITLKLVCEHQVIAIAIRPRGDMAIGIIRRFHPPIQTRPYDYYGTIDLAGHCASGTYNLTWREAWDLFTERAQFAQRLWDGLD